jgi:phosphonate transport system substrate-binding protein
MMVRLIGGLALLLLLAACQPAVVEVEVTRLVEETTGNVTAVPTPPPLEITRLVTAEVTRIVVEEIPIEVTKAPLGTAERPIQILFVPSLSLSPAIITSRGQPLADALSEATGLEYAIGIADSEEALIDLLCTAPADTIAILSPWGYGQANLRCGAQAGSTAIHADDLSWSAGMIVSRRDSGVATLADMAGRRGAVPDAASVPNAKAVEAMLIQSEIEAEELVEVPGDNSAMLAVFNGDVDFAVGSYTPPIMPNESRLWQYGVDSPEIWRQTGRLPERSPIGYVLVIAEPEFGGYRLRDARAGIFDIQPEIYSQTRIVALTPQIPNETVTFGRDFPLGLSRQVVETLQAFGESEECATSVCAADFYNWRGLEPADIARYATLSNIVQLTINN